MGRITAPSAPAPALGSLRVLDATVTVHAPGAAPADVPATWASKFLLELLTLGGGAAGAELGDSDPARVEPPDAVPGSRWPFGLVTGRVSHLAAVLRWLPALSRRAQATKRETLSS
jgi:hypothetical protein